MRARAFLSFAGLGSLALGVVACSMAPCTGDPNTDPVDCVQSGISSGAYQRRVETRQAEAREAQRQVEAAKAENQRLEEQIAEARAQEQVLRAKIAAQRSQLDRLADKINQLAAQGQLTPGENGLRRAQLDFLRQRQAALQKSSENTAELRRKAADLQSEIDALSTALARVKG